MPAVPTPDWTAAVLDMWCDPSDRPECGVQGSEPKLIELLGQWRLA